MHIIYDRWPEIATSSYELNYDYIDFKNIDHIVFAGMGGSGAIGDIFSAILSRTNIHVNVVKGYLLPKTVDSKTLVVVTSISGNTDEAIKILYSTNKLNCKTIVFSSGGLVEKYCLKNKIEYRRVQKFHSSRASLVNYFYSTLKVLEQILKIKKTDVAESITKMKIMSRYISSYNLSDTNGSLKLANWITNIPLMYYPWGLQAAAIRFKNSLQENAKSHVIVEDIIESCHNGIVAWEKSSCIKPILLEGENDYIKTKERWDIIKEYFRNNNIDYREIFAIKGNIISKLITLVYFLDYTTIYCAIISKLDPTPVKSIEFVKNKLVTLTNFK